jgi:hypothetical protein
MALERKTQGFHLYTFVQERRLLHYGWLIERQTIGYSKPISLRLTHQSSSITLPTRQRGGKGCTSKPSADCCMTPGIWQALARPM